MNKYLYIYNYTPEEKALCQMEFKQIFHQPMTTNYFITEQDFDYQRSPYIRGKLDIFIQSTNFQDLINYIIQNNLSYLDFKVIYLKNTITHIDYKESLQKCKDIAYPINGSVNMKHPKHTLAFTKIHNQWIFGLYHHDMIWNQRFHKPHSYSHSLSSKDARAFVNIAVGLNTHQKVVDPCCGIGTVVLEALSMNIPIHGYDINRYVAYQARLNLGHFGYDPLLIQKCDIHTLKQYYDIAIMDIPYGIYSPYTYQQQCSLLQESYRLASRLLLISHIDMRSELESIGYSLIDQCSITKGSLTRHITLVERKDSL